jgi:hypothetical protein
MTSRQPRSKVLSARFATPEIGNSMHKKSTAEIFPSLVMVVLLYDANGYYTECYKKITSNLEERRKRKCTSF